MQVGYLGKKSWAYEGATNLYPEEVVAKSLLATGNKCSWCEGGSVNLLLKAAALKTLARRNFFKDRKDAISRLLEAQLTILECYGGEILDGAATVSNAVLRQNIAEICADQFIRKTYPRVQQDFLFTLADSISAELRTRILQFHMLKPYEFRAGWPDLTVIGSEGLSFIEVKTTDRFHESQLRFAAEVAAPLGLQCSVIQLIPEPFPD